MSEKTQHVPHIISIKVAFPVEDERDALEKRAAILAIIADLPNAKLDFSILSLPGGIEAPQGPTDARTANRL